MVAVLLGAAAAARAVSAAAAAPSESPVARLDVAADPACATADDLAARVTQRSARIRFSTEPGVARSLRVEVAPDPHGAVAATLEVAEAGGARAVRRLSASTCGEAMDALAVMIAVLLDPRALIAPPAETGPPPPVEIEAPPPPLPPRRWGVGIGAAAHTIAGPTPQAAPGLAFGLAIAPEPGTGSRFWSPAARLRWAHSWAANWRAPGGTAAFALDSLELDACPVILGTPAVALRGCAAAIGSRVVARGSLTFGPESHVEYQLAAGGAAWLSLRVAPHVDLEGSLGAGANLRRDSFAFRPDAFYRVTSMTFSGSLGLNVTFP